MIKKDYLRNVLDNEKSNIIEKLVGLDEKEKIVILKEYCEDVSTIIENQKKAIYFAETMIENIFEENPELRAKDLATKVVEDKLYVKWNKLEEKIEIDFEKSSKLLNDKKYLQAIEIFIKDMSGKLSKRQKAYLLQFDQLRNWDKF